jgi:hypothetical protein
VLAGDHHPADVVHQAGGLQVGLGEGRVVALGHHDVPADGGQRIDDLGALGAHHGVLTEQAQLHVAGLMGVVAIDHDPVLAAAGSLRERADPFDGRHGGRIGQPPVHEVLQHVDDHQCSVHPALPQRSDSAQG